jgi:2-oxo-4-hydroxy-4-carboxy-5-ureidoimidazoline decarboxylase
MSAAELTIAELNALDRAAFIARFGDIYEQSPWVAEAAWQARPFADGQALETAMREAVLRAGRARQLALLRAHPRLGTRLALTAHSQAEQAGAGLAGLSPAERSELETLNDEYERKFDFPFIYAVRNASLRAILESCRERIGADADREFNESLRQVFRIAGFRLAGLS